MLTDQFFFTDYEYEEPVDDNDYNEHLSGAAVRSDFPQ